MGNLLKLIDQQTMKMCDKVGKVWGCCCEHMCAGWLLLSLALQLSFHSCELHDWVQPGLSHLNVVESRARDISPSCTQAVGGCGMKNSVVHTLNSLPLVFTLQLGWGSNHEQPHNIAATLAAVDDTVSCCGTRLWPCALAGLLISRQPTGTMFT